MRIGWLGKKRLAGVKLMLSAVLLTGMVSQGVWADSAGQTGGGNVSVQEAVYGDGDQGAVNAAGAPVLDPLPSERTNAHQVTISGTAEKGASVQIWYALDGGESAALGEPAAADGSGRFTVDVSLDEIGEGTYSFSASEIVDGQEGTRSGPVTLKVDWTPAGDVFDVTWSMLTPAQAIVSWNPPMVEGDPNPIPNPDIAGYRIYDDTAEAKLGETGETHFSVPVTEGADKLIRITTVDHAGNESSGTTVSVAGSSAGETVLTELNKPASEDGFEAVLSGDGSTAVYTDTPAADVEQRLVFIVRENLGGFMEKDMFSPTKEGSGLPDGSIHSLRVDETGDRVVFISDATNLTASPGHAGEHVYLYDRKKSGLELLSTPGTIAREPAISRDGRYVVFSENGRIYRIDLNADPSERRKLISDTVDGTPEDGTSSSAAISGDGTRIAFVSSSRNIKGKPAPYPGTFIYLYDAEQGIAVDRFADHNRYDHLEMDDEGRFIAYNSGYSPSRDDAYVLDVETGTEINVNGSRSVWDNSYDKVMITGDGSRVLAQLTEYASDRARHYSELFRLNEPGNPAVPGGADEDTFGAAIDREGKRLIYGRGNSLYALCLADCQTTDPGSALTSARWSVNSQVDDQLMAGGTLTLEAGGSAQQQVEAVISFKTAGSDEIKQKTVPMPEESSTGYYRGTVQLDETMAEIVSGTVQLQGGSSSISLDRFPVKVAGVLAVSVETDKADSLDGLVLYAAADGREAVHKEMSRSQLNYELQLKSGTAYTVGIRYGDAILASREGVILEGGRTSGVKLAPEFLSSLKVTVNPPKGTPLPEGIKVKFTPAGQNPVEADVDPQGTALLPGKLPANSSVTVQVIPPAGYKAGAERTVQLSLGENEISFDLFSIAESVTKVTMKYDYDQTVGQGSDTVPVMGSTAHLIVEGKPGLSLQASVLSQQWKDGKKEQAETKVELSETKEPGIYSGDYPIGEGTASIDTAVMLVGGDRLPEPFPIHKNVAGRLKISLDVPEGREWKDPFQGAFVEVMYLNDQDYLKRHYTWQQVKNDTWNYNFDVPYNNLAYRVLLSYGSGLVPQDMNAPQFDFGQTAELKITPKYMVRFFGDVRGPKGEPVRSDYTLTDSEGNVVLKGNTYGSYDLRVSAVKDQEYTLKLTPNDSYYLPEELKVSANAINVKGNVSVEAKPPRKLEGTVTGTDGSPVQSASVTAVLEGSSKAFQAFTNKDGAYSIDIPAGNVKVRASFSGSKGKLSRFVNVTVPDNGSAAADLKLLDYATVNYKLYTILNGVKEGPVTFDWRVAYHYHMETSLPVLSYGPPFQVAGVAGDTFRVCVDGRDGALPTACGEVTIPDSNQAELEMTLQGIGAQVTVSYINEEKPAENNVNLQLYRIEDGKIAYKNVNYRRIGGKYVLDIPESGRYRLVAYGQGGKTAVTEFDAAASENKELPPQKLSVKGKFAGQEGNGISLSRDLTTPGGTIVARVLYASVDANNVVSAEQAAVNVDLPDGLEYIPTSVVVNGKPAEGTLSGGRLTVPVGTIRGGASGAVQFSLKVKDQALDNATFMASISYQGAPEERLGSATIQLSYATIQAPEVVASQEFTVSGTSLPGSKVDVYDGDVLLGEAQVSPQGGWVLSIRLPSLGLSNHELRTIVQTGGPGVAGQTALVRFDPNDPGLEQISMRQGDGRIQTFRTDNGVAVFPFVYVPGQPFMYKISFRNPDRISNVKVWMGLESAEATRVGNEFVTSMILKGDPGPITVTYDKKEDAQEAPANPPTEGELRNTLPQAMRNYEVVSVTPPGGTTPEGEKVPAGTVKSLIHVTDNIDAKVTIRRTTAAGSAPTDQERRKMDQTGIPVFGSSTGQTGGSKSRTFTVKIKVPGEVAAALTGEPVSAANRSSSLNSLALDPQEIALIIEMLNRGTQAYDLSSGIMSLVSPGVIERINADYEAALALCDPQAAEYYSNFALEIKYDIAWHEFFKNAINILSTKLEGVGALLFWAESYLAGQELDNIVNNELEELESHLKQYDCKIKPYPSKPPKKPLAKPKYIFDPSGYVYEGMTGNRLEGVTATALELDPDSGNWNEWDASWYEQVNPQTTDVQGKYGWDVPQGKWKIKYEKPGYETAYSDEMDVPPPRFEVNIPLVSKLPAKIDSVRAYPAGNGTRIRLRFTKPIDLTDVDLNQAVTITDGTDTQGNPASLAGGVEAVNPETNGGKKLAMELEFTPAENLSPGGEYGYSVSGSLFSYAGVPIGGALTGTVTAGDSVPPREVQDLSASISGGKATVMWSIPQSDGSNQPVDRDLKAFKIAVTEQGKGGASYEWTVPASQMWALKSGFSDTQPYVITVSAVDEWGNESKGAAQNWTPAAAQDWTAPPSVSGLKVTSAGKDRITVSWNPSSAPDLDHYILNWSEQGGTEQVLTVAKSESGGTLSGLKPGTVYDIRVKAADAAGNESGSDSITAATEGADDSNGGSGNSGGNSNGGNTGGDSASGSSWTVPAAGGTFRTPDGLWQLEIPDQTFTGETRLQYLSKPDGTGNLPAGYRAYSGTLLLSGGSAGPAKRLKLAVSCDPAALGSMDPRRLGLYKKDASAPQGWKYIGGTVDAANHRIAAKIKELGEYALLVYDHPFGDMNSHWSLPEVNVLVSRHIVSGVSETAFEPERRITRAEVTKLLVSLLKLRAEAAGETLPSGEGTAFTDVQDDAWYAQYVKQAAASGLIQGANGKFRPQDTVTREELALLFTRFARLSKLSLPEPDAGVLKPFGDAERLSDWAKANFTQAVAMGWIRGVEAHAVDPAGAATRAQTAVMLLRVMKSLEE